MALHLRQRIIIAPSVGDVVLDGSQRLDQVVALVGVSANPGSGRRLTIVKDLCEPSDVGDENQLLGQVVLVASKYSNDISSTQAVALAKPLQVRV